MLARSPPGSALFRASLPRRLPARSQLEDVVGERPALLFRKKGEGDHAGPCHALLQRPEDPRHGRAVLERLGGEVAWPWIERRGRDAVSLTSRSMARGAVQLEQDPSNLQQLGRLPGRRS